MASGMGGRSPLFGDAKIIRAATEILAEGGEVTPYTLAGKLGGGSPPYYKKALRRLVRDGKIELPSESENEFKDVTEQISEILTRAKNELKVAATKDFDTQRQQFENANAGLREELAICKAKLIQVEDSFANLKTELNNNKSELAKAKEKVEWLKIQLATSTERCKSLTESLSKEELKSAANLDRLHAAHMQFQGERKELLNRLENLSATSRIDLENARQAERLMRDQLKMALKDGLKHTTDIAQLREQIKKMQGGLNLLKKYGSWEKISGLCLAAVKASKKPKGA